MAGHIATVSQIWALIEYQLAFAFVVLSGSNLAIGTVFSDVVAIRNRLKMIDRLARAFLDAPDWVVFKTLSERVDRMSKRWSDVVHGLWSIRDDKPDVIFLTKMFPANLAEAKSVSYNHKRFIDLENDLEILRFDLSKFSNHLMELAQAKPFPRPFLLP